MLSRMDDERAGIEQVGELPVIRRRERVTFETHSEAYRAGRNEALGAALAYCIEQQAATPAYEDTRPWVNMRTYLQDRIRANGATA